MRLLRIERVSKGRSTLSRWSLGGTSFSCVGIEPPWMNNTPFKSCIPAGVYRAKLSYYNAGGYQAYELLNVEGRTDILIHAANKASQLAGCLAPGEYIDQMDNEVAVTNSRNTLRDLHAYLDGAVELIVEVI